MFATSWYFIILSKKKKIILERSWVRGSANNRFDFIFVKVNQNRTVVVSPSPKSGNYNHIVDIAYEHM